MGTSPPLRTPSHCAGGSIAPTSATHVAYGIVQQRRPQARRACVPRHSRANASLGAALIFGLCTPSIVAAPPYELAQGAVVTAQPRDSPIVWAGQLLFASNYSASGTVPAPTVLLACASGAASSYSCAPVASAQSAGLHEIRYLTPCGARLYFSALTSGATPLLYAFDGGNLTAPPALALPASYNSPRGLTCIGNASIFMAASGPGMSGVFIVNASAALGDVAGVSYVSSTSGVTDGPFVAVNSTVYCVGDIAGEGREIVAIDAVARTSQIPQQPLAGSESSHPAFLTEFRGNLYFTAVNSSAPNTPRRLYALEYVPGGGQVLAPVEIPFAGQARCGISPSSSGTPSPTSTPSQTSTESATATASQTLSYNGTSDVSGTASATMVLTPSATRSPATPAHAAGVTGPLFNFKGETLYVSAAIEDEHTTAELYALTADACTIALVADVVPGPGGASPADFAVFDSHLFFTATVAAANVANDGAPPRTLWYLEGSDVPPAGMVGPPSRVMPVMVSLTQWLPDVASSTSLTLPVAVSDAELNFIARPAVAANVSVWRVAPARGGGPWFAFTQSPLPELATATATAASDHHADGPAGTLGVSMSLLHATIEEVCTEQALITTAFANAVGLPASAVFLNVTEMEGPTQGANVTMWLSVFAANSTFSNYSEAALDAAYNSAVALRAPLATAFGTPASVATALGGALSALSGASQVSILALAPRVDVDNAAVWRRVAPLPSGTCGAGGGHDPGHHVKPVPDIVTAAEIFGIIMTIIILGGMFALAYEHTRRVAKSEQRVADAIAARKARLADATSVSVLSPVRMQTAARRVMAGVLAMPKRELGAARADWGASSSSSVTGGRLLSVAVVEMADIGAASSGDPLQKTRVVVANPLAASAVAAAGAPSSSSSVPHAEADPSTGTPSPPGEAAPAPLAAAATTADASSSKRSERALETAATVERSDRASTKSKSARSLAQQQRAAAAHADDPSTTGEDAPPVATRVAGGGGEQRPSRRGKA